MDICKERDMCVGCGVCVCVCPHKAVNMQEDQHGFFYPEINNALCAACNKCVESCPANKAVETTSTVQEVYVAWNKNRKIRKASSSGGIFSLLAEKTLQKKGAVAGVILTEDFMAKYVLIDKTEDLHFLYGSKYVQSHTLDIYQKVKTVLNAGNPVLFSGTPCQNYALQQYLGKPYRQLLQVDLICHGVPSDAVFKRYLKELSSSEKVKSVDFRSKTPHWDFYNVQVCYCNGKKQLYSAIEDGYLTLFNKGYTLRESCRTCHYAGLHRYGDITLGDYWGYVSTSLKTRDFYKGASMVLINSSNGERAFHEIEDRIVYAPSQVSNAIQVQQMLRNQPSCIEVDKAQAFWSDYEQGMSIGDLRKKYVPVCRKKPKLLWLRHLKSRYWWALK